MRVLWLATAVLAIALTACGSSSPGHAAGVQTRVVQVRPVTSDGVPVPGYRTTSRAADATCEPGSEAIGQAYRCFAGNYVYDPCWAAQASTTTVLCVADPWQRTDARLEVSAPLPAIPNEGGIGEPWGVQLGTGQRCLLVQGAHPMFAGRVVDYICGGHLGLLRPVHKGTRPWSAQSVHLATSGQITSGATVSIVVAWFGSPNRFR